MKLQIVTTAGERLEYQLDPDQPAIRLEFRVLGMDPDMLTAYWLSDLSELRVSDHPTPIVQGAAERPELETVTVTRAEAIAGKAAAVLLEDAPDFYSKVAYSYKRPVQPKVTKKKAAS